MCDQKWKPTGQSKGFGICWKRNDSDFPVIIEGLRLKIRKVGPNETVETQSIL